MPDLTGVGTAKIPTAHGPIAILGSLPVIDPLTPLASMIKMSYKYGEIYRIWVPSKLEILIVSSYSLFNELCDEKRFRKQVTNVLEELRVGVNDGLFTARNDEPNWGIAHRILLPTFGPMSIRGMFDEMYDIASQAALKWARYGSQAVIDVADDFSRLTFDTLALCTMGYRFNSFYQSNPPKFFQAMGEFLIEAGDRPSRVLPSFFHRKSTKRYRENIALLRKTADEVLQVRKQEMREHGSSAARKDLLMAMLEGVDPKTGQKMTDASIMDNLLTFLVAGHETTGGLLSFAFFRLLKNPTVLRKAQQEVDEVAGKNPIRPEHLPKFHYINAILRETLRMSSGIPVFGIEAIEDTTIGGGKYFISKGVTVLGMLARTQTDPSVFGDDADEFKPERMLDENFERLQREFPNCWKPFGNGMRGCIGRPFAWQEAVLVTAMALQNFNFVLHDPDYQLEIQETLTIKPRGLQMRAILRDNITPTELEHRLAGHARPSSSSSNPKTTTKPADVATGTTDAKATTPINIFYGSNSGTCEAMAHRLAADAASQGFRASIIDSLDAANQAIPTDGPVVIIAASYEGQPTDNAAHFVAWLESLSPGSQQASESLSKVGYAVFGCGHHDWSTTFHRIPKLIDSKLAALGASRLAPMGLTDAADGDMFVDFETWETEKLWPALAQQYAVATPSPETSSPFASSALDVQISTPRAISLRQKDLKDAVVVAALDLIAPGSGQPLKRHIEIKLPSGTMYKAGDYLAVLPLNPARDVARAIRRFGLAGDAHVTISAPDGGRATTLLPTGNPVAVQDVLGAYVELGQPATKRALLTLAEACTTGDVGRAARQKLTELAGGESYAAEISAPRVSVLDLLERFPDVSLPFGRFLALLPPMRVRQYSISSSPLWNSEHVTLTYSVLDGIKVAASSGGDDKDKDKDNDKKDKEKRHLGVASSYLASLAPGDHLHVSPRPSHSAFHLPPDSSRTPVVCIAAGSGIAPFRGFVQERAALLGAGRTLAPMLLFFGCRHPDRDDLYRDELGKWEAAGAVSVRRAYSRYAMSEGDAQGESASESRGCRYVQERMWHDREEVAELWDKGAKVFVCGSREVGEGVKETVYRIAVARAGGEGKSAPEREEVQRWFDGIRNERFATDVFDV